MKFLLTLAVWAITGAIVLTFFVFRGSDGESVQTTAVGGEQEISVELTTSFNTEKNIYSLSDEPLLAVFLDGKSVYESDEKIIKGRPLLFNVMHLADGVHEIMVTGNAADDGGDNALRIRVKSDGLDIGDSTEWFENGQNIVSVMRFTLGNSDEK